MTVHVLDTGAVFVLLKKHRPPLRRLLEEADERNEYIRIPAPVLVELGQGSAPPRRALENVLRVALVVPLDKRTAEAAAEALCALGRSKCNRCSNFTGPSLVDAAVMAFAADCAEVDDALVYTQDDHDLMALRDARFTKVVVRRV